MSVSPARVMELAGAQVQVFADAPTASEAAADHIARLILDRAETAGKAVLGLATGATPVAVYARLVERHRAGTLPFGRVVSYNLDEYYPISPLDPNSYRAYMHQHLFAHVDIPAHQAHVLDGSVPEAFAAEQAAAFDRWIEAEGGLDLQLLGIGRNGHIGFNEPTDLTVEQAIALPTRMVSLHPTTVADAVKDFGGVEAAVPRRALTVGVGPILAARSILVLAFGPNKADAVARSLTGPMTAQVPGSLLQSAAGKVTWLIDEAAAAGLA